METFLLPMENKTIGQMIKLFLSCQSCCQVSMKPKQLKCSHTICTRCALRQRTRNIDAAAWMLECATCGRMNIWQDGNAELSGLDDNHLMQQVLKQMTGRNTILSKTLGGPNSSHELDFDTIYGDKNMTINIVSAVKERIEIQEALMYAEKKMMKCQQQTRYVKSYEKKVAAAKSAIAQKITQSAEILIANVIEEQAKLLRELDQMFEEDMEPVNEAKTNIQKQTQSLELLTRCCEVATQMLHNGRAPLDMHRFKKMVENSVKSWKEFCIPEEIKQKYKTKVQYSCDVERFQCMVRDFGELRVRGKMEEHKKETKIEQEKEEQSLSSFTKPLELERSTCKIEEFAVNQPIYDLPPDAEFYKPFENNVEENTQEIIYDEIPEEYYNIDYQPSERPYVEYSTDRGDSPDPIQPPPRPPKNYMKFSQYKTHMGEEETAAMVLAQRRRQVTNGADSETEGDTTDSFFSDTDEEEVQCHQAPALPPRTLSKTSHASANFGGPELKTPYSSNVRMKRNSQESSTNHSTDTDSSTGHHNSRKEFKRFSLQRSASIRSMASQHSVSPPSRRRSSRFLFRIGRIRKAGSRESQMFMIPPEIAAGEDGTIWIADTNGHRVQAHEETCGNLVASFKTSLNGVTLKPKGLTVMERGSKVATTCGKYVTIWDREGNFTRKYGPRSNLGKLCGVAEGANGNLILGDIDNTQIAVERSQVKITAIGTVAGVGKSSWPGRLTVNSHGQIVTADYTEHCIKIFNPDGSLVTRFGSFGTGHGQMRYPCAVAVDSHDRIYIADECNNRITLFSSDGLTCFGDVLTKEDGLNFPHAIAVLANGSIAVSDDSKFVKVYVGFNAHFQ